MPFKVNILNLSSGWWINTKDSDKNNSSNTAIGNILFQLAYGLTLALDNNDKMCCPDIAKWCSETFENIDQSKTIWRNVNIENIDCKHDLNDILKNKKMNKEHIQDGIMIKNFCQWNTLFDKKYLRKFRDFFGPNDEDLKYIYSKYGKFLKNNNCSIHVRRGKDYLKIASKYNPEFILKESYYYKALDHFKDKNIDNYLVFSDNMEYSKNFFSKNFPNLNFIFIRERDFIDLWIISLCKNNILSNSTFSMWGSFLNKNKNKIVIAPKKTNKYENDKINKKILNTSYEKSWIVMSE